MLVSFMKSIDVSSYPINASNVIILTFIIRNP